ncbi:ABC transporter permease [Sphingomonadaceae bacterium jetA1]|jgi:ABC-2 type transport system permease protein|uniref:ABC transporter permease n=1 Tax=Facivitalis istanbulensis TaxID=3075838 RepID=UPI003488004B
MTMRSAFESTLWTILTTRDLMAVAILSVILYAFYYPAPYAHQTAQAMPLVVVDDDHSAMSRSIVAHLGDTRAVRVIAEVPDMAAARAAVRAREAEGILLLSSHLGADLLTGRPGAGIGLWLNGTYLLRAESIGSGMVEVVEDAVAERREAMGRRPGGTPSPILVHPLFNTIGGYRDYIFPAVANIILQQTLLFASARLMAERRRRRDPRLGLAAALGTWAACATIGILAAFFYFGFVYWVQDMPRAGNIPALLIAVPLFAGAVAALGLAAGTLFRNGDDALKILLPTSVPLVFLAGFAWPLDAMPRWLATLVWASPATSAMHLFTRLNQMGATLDEVTGPLLVLAGLIALYLPVFLWRQARAPE